MRRLRRRREERGAAAVEFALVMIPFFALVFGLIEYGWYFYVAQNTSGAVSTVTRKLQVGDCWGGTDAYTYAHNQSAQITSLTKSPAQTTPPDPGTSFTVTVTADANLFGFIPIPDSGVITRTVTANLEDTTASTC